MSGGGGIQKITSFDFTHDGIVIGGNPLNGASLPTGITASDADGSTVIQYGVDDYVVLRGVSLAQWQAGAAAQILGSAADDVLAGDETDNVFDGGGGNDTIVAGAGNDRINYASDNDVIMGDASNEGIDTLDLRRFNAGDVQFKVAGSGVLITTSDGTILLDSQVLHDLGSTFSNIETILFKDVTFSEADIRSRAIADQTTAGDDSIFGTAFADAIYGDTGNDTIQGLGGNDTLAGGAGDDSYVVDSTTDIVFEDAGEGTDLILASISFVLGAEVENLILTGSDSISGTGNEAANLLAGNAGSNLLSGLGGNDSIFGGDGADTLYGGDGADTLDGGTGADSMTGGLGDDVYIVDNAADAVVEEASGGVDTVQASITFTLSTELENLTLTGSAAISGTGNATANVLTGNAGANLLSGLDGNDSIYGGDGADTLDGGTGADSMTGGLGEDVYVVDNAADVIVEGTSGGIDSVQSSVTFTLSADVENLTLSGTAAINGTGNASDNVITGNTAANSLSGLDGNDSLDGGSGNDTLFGGAGNDTLNGGANSDSMTGGSGDDTYIVNATADVVVEAVGEGIDTVQSNVNWTLGANVENLIFYSNSGLTGIGNALANQITGNSGANALSGLDGDDTLIGGGGNDALTGGNGADQFVYNSTSSGVDVIADFNQLDGGSREGDVLRFIGLGVGTFAYMGTGAFSGGSDNSEARINGNQVLVDTNGDGTADITITLTGLTSASQLTASDFLFG